MLYNKNQSACNAFHSEVCAELSKVFLAHRSSTLPAHKSRLVSVQWTANLAAFSCPQWIMDMWWLSLMSIHEILTYCRWWTAWREATSCWFGRPCCFGHSEIVHSIFKNENSCTDLCIWKPLVMVAGSGVFQNSAVFEWQQLEQISYTNRSQTLKWKLSSPPSQGKILKRKLSGGWQAITERWTELRGLALLLVKNVLIDLPNQSAWHHTNMSKRICRILAKLSLTSFLLEHSKCNLPTPDRATP